MNTNKSLTVLEALKHIRTDLGKIPVKVEDIVTIGNPIHAAVLNISAVITALENQTQQEQAKPTEPQKNAQPQPTNQQEGDNNGKDADN